MDQAKGKARLFRLVIPAFSGFNIYSGIASKTTALGPVVIASVVDLLPGWKAEVIDENNLLRIAPRTLPKGADHEILQQIDSADIVGFYGGLSSTIPRLYEVAKFYKSLGVTTIAGGQHFVVENIREALDSGIDYVVIGEGDVTIKELVEALGENKPVDGIQGIAFMRDGEVVVTASRPLLTDFEDLPLPDFSLVRYARIKVYPVERIRGCGMDCEFCTVRGKPRPASAERIFSHITGLVEKYNAKYFFMVDDLFGQQRDETIRFCHMLAHYQKSTRRKLHFAVQIRLDKAKDTELLKAMRMAGVYMVAIGFESPIEEELKAMRKRILPKEMIALARIYHEQGFLVHGMFIFTYPMKDSIDFSMPVDERIKRFKHFAKEARIDTLQVLLPVPLPGTEMTQRLREQGRIFPKEDIGWEYYDGNFPLFVPDAPMTTHEMLYAIKKIMGKFYRFRYMFAMGWHIISFPVLLFFLDNMQKGWGMWYRSWRNALVRFGGSFVIRGWFGEFNKGVFLKKLASVESKSNAR